MNTDRIGGKWTKALLLAALVATAAAPGAEARHGGWRRYKDVPSCGGGAHHVFAPTRVVEVRGPSCGVSSLAGFIGGLALGAVLSSPSPPPDDYYYFDPYCGERFASLEIYRDHLRYHRHPRIARVIEIDSGACVHTWRYQHGGWTNWDEEDDD